MLSKLDTSAAAKVVGVLEAADAADMLEKAIRFKRWDTQRVAAVLSACPPDPATRILGYDSRTLSALSVCPGATSTVGDHFPTQCCEPNGSGELDGSAVRQLNVLPVRFCSFAGSQTRHLR